LQPHLIPDSGLIPSQTPTLFVGPVGGDDIINSVRQWVLSEPGQDCNKACATAKAANHATTRRLVCDEAAFKTHFKEIQPLAALVRCTYELSSNHYWHLYACAC
jgi:hypothetical protein